MGKMTLMGKVFMCLFFLSAGVAIGFYYGSSETDSNTGNKIEVNVDGKVKQGSDVNINIEGNDQEQTKKKQENTSWWEFWK